MVAMGASRGAVGMDILHLIERLENLAVVSPKMPVMGKVMIDPQQLLDLVDQMRIALPESVREAERLIEERSRRPRPEPVVTIAPEVRARVDGHDLARLAQQRAQEIVGEAEREAERLIEDGRRRAQALQADAEAQRRGADEYARDVLGRLETQLAGMLTTVQRGIETLERDHSSLP